MANSTRFVIHNAPSKFDIMVSLLDGDMLNRRSVKFYLNDGDSAKATLDIVINSLKRGNDNGEIWLFTGYLTGGAHRSQIVPDSAFDHFVYRNKGKQVYGSYHIHARQGWISEGEPLPEAWHE